MNIGILTFVNTTNYGASLQAYALQQVILGLGHDCEIIRYSNPCVSDNHDPKSVFRRHGAKKIIAPLLYCIYKARLNRFNNFEETHCKFSQKCDRGTIKAVTSTYDLILVGSDQVWNTDITGGDKSFFLDFLEDNKKKCSYAASVGTGYFSSNSNEWEKLISQFRIISVREYETAEMLRNKLQRNDIFCDIDPTLLLYNKWRSFVSEPIIKGNYIIMYLTPDNEQFLNSVRLFAQKKGCKLYLLKKGAGYKRNIKTINIASPIDFINYIAYAKYVITGSFHALCFSMMLRTNFFVTSSKEKNRTGRLTNLLSICNVDGHVVYEPEYLFDETSLDFDNIAKCIEKCAASSMRTIETICK